MARKRYAVTVESSTGQRESSPPSFSTRKHAEAVAHQTCERTLADLRVAVYRYDPDGGPWDLVLRRPGGLTRSAALRLTDAAAQRNLET